MRAWPAILSLIFSAPLFGQVAFYAGEERIDVQFPMGTAAVGDVLERPFSLRNVGTTAAAITSISISGAGFSLVETVPAQTLPPGGQVNFAVRFRAEAAGAYSANLSTEGASIIVRATAVAMPIVRVEEGGVWRTLTTASVVDFGAVERGSSLAKRFAVEPAPGQPIVASDITVTGTGFRMVTDAALGPFFFQVIFEPSSPGSYSGFLVVGQRRFALSGMGLEPALPTPEIVLEIAEMLSGQQGTLAIRFAEPPKAGATGVVQMTFAPSVPAGSGDPTVSFASGQRTANFSVVAGNPLAQFGTSASIGFQTGTTAGTISFRATVGGVSTQKDLTIAAATIHINGVTGSRTGSTLEVRVTGFDNSRSAGRVSFTFSDRNGNAIPPGAIQTDVSADFRSYFERSEVGGVFSLRAVFPVTGSSEQIDAVEVAMPNSVGTARSARVRF